MKNKIKQLIVERTQVIQSDDDFEEKERERERIHDDLWWFKSNSGSIRFDRDLVNNNNNVSKGS